MNSDLLIEAVARFFALLRERQIEYVLVGDPPTNTWLWATFLTPFS